MKYVDKSFMVPVSGGSARVCVEQGHAFADRRGRCVRCGQKIRATAFGEPIPSHPESKRRPKVRL